MPIKHWVKAAAYAVAAVFATPAEAVTSLYGFVDTAGRIDARYVDGLQVGGQTYRVALVENLSFNQIYGSSNTPLPFGDRSQADAAATALFSFLDGFVSGPGARFSGFTNERLQYVSYGTPSNSSITTGTYLFGNGFSIFSGNLNRNQGGNFLRFFQPLALSTFNPREPGIQNLSTIPLPAGILASATGFVVLLGWNGFAARRRS